MRLYLRHAAYATGLYVLVGIGLWVLLGVEILLFNLFQLLSHGSGPLIFSPGQVGYLLWGIPWSLFSLAARTASSLQLSDPTSLGLQVSLVGAPNVILLPAAVFLFENLRELFRSVIPSSVPTKMHSLLAVGFTGLLLAVMGVGMYHAWSAILAAVTCART